jgi:hypothetical protein
MDKIDRRWAGATTSTMMSKTCEVLPAEAADDATSPHTVSATGRMMAHQINLFPLLLEPVVKQGKILAIFRLLQLHWEQLNIIILILWAPLQWTACIHIRRASFINPGRASFINPGRASFINPGRASFINPGRASFANLGRTSCQSGGRIVGVQYDLHYAMAPISALAPAHSSFLPYICANSGSTSNPETLLQIHIL